MSSLHMPVKKAEEMETHKDRGRANNKEVGGCSIPVPPLKEAKKPKDVNLQSSELPPSQVPGALEHPQTPAPWSRQRANRFSRNPAAGEGGTSLSSTHLPKEMASLAGGGDQQMKLLSLKQQPDGAQAAEILENFLGHFLTYLQECPDRPYFRGTREMVPRSPYECEKLLHPDEFEVLLPIPVPDYVQSVEVEGYSGLFHILSLLRKSRSFPAALLLEDGKTISPQKTMEEFRKHVDNFVQAFYAAPFPGWQVRLEKKKPNCPAVSLVILDSHGGKFLSVSLIPALEMAGQWSCTKKAKDLLGEKAGLHLTRVFYFIAKQSPGRHNKETWRISFSHVEKEILNRHRSSQACTQYHKKECCRQECLKMLGGLVDDLKMKYPQMLAHLSPYHTQTSFLHTLWEWRCDQEWKPSSINQCFERTLSNFIHEVATANLTHFFLPKCNLFGAKFFPPTKLKFLWMQLKEKEGATKRFTLSRKRGSSATIVNPDMTWPLMVTLGLIVLVSVFLPQVAT